VTGKPQCRSGRPRQRRNQPDDGPGDWREQGQYRIGKDGHRCDKHADRSAEYTSQVDGIDQVVRDGQPDRAQQRGHARRLGGT
jgi:hypothetical protein